VKTPRILTEGPVVVEVNRATGGAFEEPEQLTIWMTAAS